MRRSGTNQITSVACILAAALVALLVGSTTSRVEAQSAMASAAAYSQFRPPVAGDVLRRRQAAAGARAEQARDQQLRGMLAQLVAMERQQANSLEECDQWANLNERYLELVGASRAQRQAPRPSEFHMNQRCRELEQALNGARMRLGQFRQALLGERQQLEFVSNLLGDYAELRAELARDPMLAREFTALLEGDPRVRAATQSLDSFVAFADETLPRLGGGLRARTVRASSQVASDEAEELDRSIRGLVDRELALNDEELRLLNEQADCLERLLASGAQVDLNSGRFRYLSGTLDAARAVLVHKLNEPGQLQQQAQPIDMPPLPQIGYLPPPPQMPAYEEAGPIRDFDEEDEVEQEQRRPRQEQRQYMQQPPQQLPYMGGAGGSSASAAAVAINSRPAQAQADPRRAEEFRAQYEGSNSSQGADNSVSGALARAEAAAAAVDATPKPVNRMVGPSPAAAAAMAGAGPSGAIAQTAAGSGAVSRSGNAAPSAMPSAVSMAASFAQQQQQQQATVNNGAAAAAATATAGSSASAAGAQAASFSSPAELMSKLRSRRFQS